MKVVAIAWPSLVTALSLFLSCPLTASPEVLMMDSRDAPSAEVRPHVKSLSIAEIPLTPLVLLEDLPSPSEAELLERDSNSDPQRESLSFGRIPMRHGVDGHIDIPAGISAIRVQLSSATALHLRSAWRFADDAEYAVTVFAGGDLTQPLVNRTGSSMNGDRQLVWSAVTAGDRQEALIVRLTPTSAAWTVVLERVAHFDRPIHPPPSSTTKKSLGVRALGLGDSAWCQKDIVCALDMLNDAGDAVVLGASRGVAFMVIATATGGTVTCTGTLLNSASYPRPFFLTAYHCIEDAVTLDTYWFYARTGCGFGTVSPATQVTGGAAFVWTSKALDTALLELNKIPPYPASYTAWNAAPITSTTEMLAVHHPRGDVKKGSLGGVVGTNPLPVPFPALGLTFPSSSMYMVDWVAGIVEPGSSGSALFTFHPTREVMEVRGTLTGGTTTCSGISSRTYYQRFDLIYPYIAAALNAPAQTPPGQLQLPVPVTFPAQQVGTQSASVVLTIKNIGGSAVAVSNVLPSNIAEFPSTTNCIGSVAVGASCQIAISFRPAAVGLRSQTVTIVSDGLGSPQSFAVSGTGATPLPTGSTYSRNYVQKTYVAYYGRPADPGGLTYWATRMDAEGQSLNAIIGAFGNSDEFNRRYGGLSYIALVTKIYQQTLGRDPDPAGLAYYVGELQAGRRTLQSVTLDVLNGATTAPDSAVVANKLDVAAYYTAKVAVGCPYGTEQDGVNAITAVTTNPASVTGAKAGIDARCGS